MLNTLSVWLSNGTLNIFIRQITSDSSSSSLKSSESAAAVKRFRDPSETSSIVIQIAMFHTQKPQHKKAGSTVVELRVVQAISAVAKKISDENLCVRILMIPHIFHHFSFTPTFRLATMTATWKGAQQKPTMKIMTKRFPFVDNRNENELAHFCEKKFIFLIFTDYAAPHQQL